MLQSDLCDYSDAYLIVKGTITVTGSNNKDKKSLQYFKTKLHSLVVYQRSTMY